MTTHATRDVVDIAIRPELDAVVDGGDVDGTPIGSTSPNVGFFTNLTCTNLTVTGSSNLGGGSGPPTGPAGGDLGGTYPNPTVVNTHLGTPLTLLMGGTGNSTGRPSGAAGGDLAGTYPNPTLAIVNSNVGTFTNATITVNGKGIITAVSTGSPLAAFLHRSTFTSGSGSFTIPATTVLAKVVGGGGGGGVGQTGSGGGGGGYTEKLFSGLTVGQTLNYAIGSGGAASTSGGVSSVSSGTQSVSSLVANPGSGGSGTTPGQGGSSSGGDINIDGGDGGTLVGAASGFGGSPGGGFGQGGGSTGTVTGNPGTGFGAGGSGGNAVGTAGLVIFEWYA